MYRKSKNELPTSRLSTVIVLQTYKQTDRLTECSQTVFKIMYYTASWVVNNKYISIVYLTDWFVNKMYVCVFVGDVYYQSSASQS